MQRSSIIATVVAAGGILIAGSVASVAVINAASSNEPDSETIQLVAAGSAATPSATASAEAPPASPAAALPSLEAAALPVLPEVADAPAEQAAPVTQAAPVANAPQPAKAKPAKSKPTRASSAPAAQDSNSLSADQARSIVLKQGDGVSVVSTSEESHQGYRTWAVRFARANGEVLTGYVDRESGIVIDWTVNKEAPAAQPTPTASYEDDSDDDESDDSDEYEDNSGSGSEDDDEYEDSDDD